MERSSAVEEILRPTEPLSDEDRMTIAQALFRRIQINAHLVPRKHSIEEVRGLAAGYGPPPDDATVERWIGEHRMRKHG